MRVEFRQAEADFRVVDTTYLRMLFSASANGSPAIGSNAPPWICHVFRPSKKRIGLGHRLKEVSANVIVPVRQRPAAMHKAAIGVFICAARRLDHAVQRDEFSNDKFSHDCSPLVIGLRINAAQQFCSADSGSAAVC